MRYILKSSRCIAFDNYIAKARPITWHIKANIKLVLHQHLWAEQKGLCVYCQQSIRKKLVKDSLDNPLHPSHIEHVRPKEMAGVYAHLIFEHTNLGVSCNGSDVDDASDILPKYCGHAKLNQHDDTLFLHPFEVTDIEEYFSYDLNGKVTPSVKDVVRAEYTISILKLDHLDLDEMRERQYQIIIEEVNNGLDIDDYLDMNQTELPKFHSMLKQLFFV
jgi:uncharacterized protein (TIGR02646 family)